MEAERLSLKRLLKLYALYARIDFQWYMRDALFCVIGVFGDFLSQLTGLMGVFILSARYNGAGGLSRDEMLLMLGMGMCVSGLSELFFGGNNVSNVSRRIGRGQVDHMLIQPVPIPMQLLAEGIMPISGGGVMACGVAVTAYAVAHLALAVDARVLALLIGMPVCSVAIMMGLTYLVSCIAFYSPVQGEESSTIAIDAITTLGRYPLGAVGPAARVVLSSIVPVGLFSWYPACVILGRPPHPLGALLPVIVAIAVSAVAALAFKRGLAHYILRGCNRYRRMGFRS